jgi:IQ calmodulin-binding motif
MGVELDDTLPVTSLLLQSFARGIFGRKHFSQVQTEVRVKMIQRCVRGWLARAQYKRMVSGVVYLQANVRRRIARRQLHELKVYLGTP